MIYQASPIAIGIFVAFVLFVLGLSLYLGNKAKSAEGYFAAGGTIHWAVNGIAFAGDYLSAASFLGICGMIAFYGYDGFLYSIGYLAGWVVALFVVAEPMKRLGKFTFTDALDARYNSRGIQLTAAISTLVVSIFYLIPQMVGAGALVTPLLGLPHWVGVIMVGVIVVFIVATAGMASTTYVQFMKGGLLIIFSTLLTIFILQGGFTTDHVDKLTSVTFTEAEGDGEATVEGYKVLAQKTVGKVRMLKLEKNSVSTWWSLSKDGTKLDSALSITDTAEGEKLYNGQAKEKKAFFQVGHAAKIVMDGKEVKETGALSPFKFISTVEASTIVRFKKIAFEDGKNKVKVWVQKLTSGKRVMRPGLKFKIEPGSSSFMDKLNFISLMLALFFGTAALPHILIRYYTVPSQKDARKSTIVAISAIGFFYILTIFMGVGAMMSGVLDVESSNMAAPLLAKHFGVVLFSIISAIAFATVLGTVSGLIVATSGAVAHDLLSNYFGVEMTDEGKVKAGKIAAAGIGALAILLGIAFKGMNVSFLVGWAFAVAASANLPSILMILFWDKTTAKGISTSIVVGIVSALGIILVSPSMFARYGIDTSSAPLGLDNPGIISIPLSFIALVVVSLMTQKDNEGLPHINDI